MAEHEAKDKEEQEEARHRKKVQPVYDQLKQAAEPEDNQMKQALAGMSAAEQASLVRNPQLQGAQRAEAMLELQQTHGNRYVQRLAQGNKEATLDEDIIHRIEAQRGSGKPLEPEVRSEMEVPFEHDFSQVRVHTDAEADKLSQGLGAKAFTTGSDVFFRQGAYQPDSESGERLLGHELAHVIQQEGKSTSSIIGGADLTGKPGDVFERQAEAAGKDTANNNLVTIQPAPYVPSIQRQGEEDITEVGKATRPQPPEWMTGVTKPGRTVIEFPAEHISGRAGELQDYQIRRNALISLLGRCLARRENGAKEGIRDFVKAHKSEPSGYGPLAVAIFSAPLAILGACVSGPAAPIVIAGMAAGVAILSSIPEAEPKDPAEAFGKRMTLAFYKATENALNKTDKIVDSYLTAGAPPPTELLEDERKMKVDLVSKCFPGELHRGMAVERAEVGRTVRAELERKWRETAPQRRERERTERYLRMAKWL